MRNEKKCALRITHYALPFRQAERKLGTSTREPDSDNADVGKNNAITGKASELGGFSFDLQLSNR